MPIASSTILSMADTAMQAISLLCLVAIVKRRIADAYGAAGLCLGSIQLGVLVGNVAGARAIDSVRMLPDGMFALAFVLMCVLACSQVLLARTESQPPGSSSASTRARFPAFGTARETVGADEFRTAVSRSRAGAFLDEEGQSSAGAPNKVARFATRTLPSRMKRKSMRDAPSLRMSSGFPCASRRCWAILVAAGRSRIFATSSFSPRTRLLPTRSISTRSWEFIPSRRSSICSNSRRCVRPLPSQAVQGFSQDARRRFVEPLRICVLRSNRDDFFQACGKSDKMVRSLSGCGCASSSQGRTAARRMPAAGRLLHRTCKGS